MKARALVIDDDEGIRGVMELMLGYLGCEVDVAEDGVQGLKKLEDPREAKNYDVIYLDIMMPKMTGYDVIEVLRSRPHTADIPIILLTALGEGDDIIAGYQSGADYYIPKPFTEAQLEYGLNMVLYEEGDLDTAKKIKADSLMARNTKKFSFSKNSEFSQALEEILESDTGEPLG